MYITQYLSWRNRTRKLLWDVDIQTDHVISARWPDLIIIRKKKKTCKIVDFAFAVPADLIVNLKESEKKDKCLDLARELKKLEHESDGYTNCNWCSWYSHRMIIKGTGGLGKKEDEWRPCKLLHFFDPKYWEESWRLEETCCHSNFKDNRLKLVWKSLNE